MFKVIYNKIKYKVRNAQCNYKFNTLINNSKPLDIGVFQSKMIYKNKATTLTPLRQKQCNSFFFFYHFTLVFIVNLEVVLRIIVMVIY